MRFSTPLENLLSLGAPVPGAYNLHSDMCDYIVTPKLGYTSSPDPRSVLAGPNPNPTPNPNPNQVWPHRRVVRRREARAVDAVGARRGQGVGLSLSSFGSVHGHFVDQP